MNYYEIGQRIRKVRKEMGYSQEQLAEMAGISVTHMSHIETANTKLSLPVIEQLAKGLRVRIDDLVHDRSSMEDQDAVQEIIELLADCTPVQLQFLLDMLRDMKKHSMKYL